MRRNEPVAGPIDRLHLPRRAWTVLERERITSLNQLKAVAAGIERVVPGIGRKTAQMIRAELARIHFHEKPHHYRGQWAEP